MKYHILITICLVALSFPGCAQENRLVSFFEGTDASELAKSVGKGDLEAIGKLVRQDTTLLGITDTVTGSNVLALALELEQFKAFKKLLELGADPNSINPYTRYSILMDAIQPFGSQFEWRKDNRYVELLLKYGADPNYAVENDFTNEKGHYIRATNPLMKASTLNIEAVKMLIKYGADPSKKIGESQSTGFTSALSMRKFDIIDYYIDTLDIDVHQPMRVRYKDSLFVQDYIKKFMNYEEGSEGYKQKQKLIQKLEGMGVDFKNYDYKL